MASPLSQFEINKIIPFEIFGYDISFTNSSLAMLVTVLLILLFLSIGLRNSLFFCSNPMLLVHWPKLGSISKPGVPAKSNTAKLVATLNIFLPV